MEIERIEELAMAELRHKKWYEYTRYLAAKSIQANRASNISFELTPLCTLRCKMCFIRLDSDQMNQMGRMRTAEEWISLAREFRDAGGITILLTGGEAMLRSDFSLIYENISKLGLFVCVFTNGTLITEDIIRLFKKRPPAMIGFTLYGASDDTYTRLCGLENGYSLAMNGLKRLLEIQNLNIDVRFTATSINYQDYPILLHQVLELGKIISFDFGDAAPVRGANSEARALRLTEEQKQWLKEEYAQLSDLVLHKMQEVLPREEINNRMWWDQSIATNNVVKRNEKGLQCFAGTFGAYIGWDGKMYPCDMLSWPYTEPFKEGFKVAFQKIKERTLEVQLPDKCVSCATVYSCINCAARAISELEDCARKQEECTYLCKEN